MSSKNNILFHTLVKETKSGYSNQASNLREKCKFDQVIPYPFNPLIPKSKQFIWEISFLDNSVYNKHQIVFCNLQL